VTGEQPTPNVRVVMAAYEAFDRRDIEAGAALATPDFEWRPYLESLRGESFRGPDGVRAFMRELDTHFERFEIERLRYAEAGERVVVFCRSSGRGRGSGVELEIESIHVWELREGKVTRLVTYLDRDEALKAAGLS
jgi:ketosteroid isomerase-like protein